MEFEPNDDFSIVFRKIRQQKGYSIKKLAPELKVGYSYLSKIENGQRSPSGRFVEKVAAFFGYDKEDLMLRAGKIPDDVLSILRNNPRKAIEFLRREFGD